MNTGNRSGTLLENVIYFKQLVTKYSFQKHIALQAHSKCSQIILHQFKSYFHCLKRVSLRLPVKGSVSIEASIAIPIFMFCFLEIMSVLNYLSVYSGVLYALKSVGDSVSVYGYVYDDLISGEEEISIGENIISALVFSEIYLNSQMRKQCEGQMYSETIHGGAQGINTLGSHVNERDKTLLLVANYTVEPVISFAGTALHMNNRYYAKLWTGFSGKKGETEKDVVFITENASVYHLYADCTHLKLSVKSVEYDELSEKRNSSGAKYVECSFCCKGNVNQGMYYITSQGDCFHQDISCLGLKRTVFCVEIEKVKDLPVCSRCNQKKGEKK